LRVEGHESPVEDKILLREIEDLIAEVAEKERDRWSSSVLPSGAYGQKDCRIPGIELSEKGVKAASTG